MRKQYYFRRSSRGLLAWDVDRLVQLSSTLPRKRISLSAIRELDEIWSNDDEPFTWRAMLEPFSQRGSTVLEYEAETRR